MPGWYNVSILTMAGQHIHCKVMQLHTMKEFFITYVYEANQEQQRRVLWEDLKQIAQDMEEAWFILEDFNYVLHLGDRMGGQRFRTMK